MALSIGLLAREGEGDEAVLRNGREEEGEKGEEERGGDPVEVHLVGGYNDIAVQSTARADDTGGSDNPLESILGALAPHTGAGEAQSEAHARVGAATDWQSQPQGGPLRAPAQRGGPSQPRVQDSKSLPVIQATLHALHTAPHAFSLRSLCLWDANTVFHPRGHPLPWCRAFWVCRRHTLGSSHSSCDSQRERAHARCSVCMCNSLHTLQYSMFMPVS